MATTPTIQKLRRIVKRNVWATWRVGSEVPCLWGHKEDAEENCDEDEMLVFVSIEFAAEDRRGSVKKVG